MRSVLAHGALFIVSAALAWTAWTREEAGEGRQGEEEDAESVVVFDLDPASVQELVFESERRNVKVASSGSGESRWFDVSTYRKDERRRHPRHAHDAGPAAADAGVAPAADAGPEVEVVETRRRFTGNAEVVEYLGKIAPLKAKRGFGVVPRGTLEEFELVEPRARLRIRAAGKTYELQVGGTTFGSSDAYVKDVRTNRVYLVAAELVRDLEFAETRFLQRELVKAENAEIAKAIVSAGGKRRTFLQKNRTEEQGAYWTDEAAPETKNELYDNWMGRVLRLRALEYLDAGKSPQGTGESAGPAPVFVVEYVGDRGRLGRVEIVKVDGDPAEFYARSDATRSWVKLSATLTEQIERDVTSVVQ